MSEERAMLSPVSAAAAPSTAANEPIAKRTDTDALFAYLQTQQGHDLATRVMTVIEGIKQSTIDKSTSSAKTEKMVQAGIILAVVIATSALVYVGKFDASVGILFGTLVGYAFGKK